VNDNIIDVLIYIYETYMEGDQPAPADQIIMEEQLLKVGFHEGEIKKAFNWLDELAWSQGMLHDMSETNSNAMRIYTDDEMQRIDKESRGLLLFLEENGILDPMSRELVVERAMAIENMELDANDIQWITLLVLMNQPGQEAAFSLMQDMIYDGIPEYLH
jgi:Smg protein